MPSSGAESSAPEEVDDGDGDGVGVSALAVTSPDMLSTSKIEADNAVNRVVHEFLSDISAFPPPGGL